MKLLQVSLLYHKIFQSGHWFQVLDRLSNCNHILNLESGAGSDIVANNNHKDFIIMRFLESL